MKYLKKLKRRKEKVEVLIPDPIPFFKKPTLPKVVFFKVHSVDFIRESKLSLS